MEQQLAFLWIVVCWNALSGLWFTVVVAWTLDLLYSVARASIPWFCAWMASGLSCVQHAHTVYSHKQSKLHNTAVPCQVDNVTSLSLCLTMPVLRLTFACTCLAYLVAVMAASAAAIACHEYPNVASHPYT
jgi:hypothetical protein